MVASLIVATSVFGQNNASCPKPCPPKPCPKPCPQPCPPTQVCPQDPCCPTWPTPVLNAAYNYPARIQTRCPWDFYADATFIYWQPIQENMELGLSDATVSPATAVNANVINMSFDYKPGFKLGIGGNFDHDNWDMGLEYTWFHNTNSTHATAPTGGHIDPSWGTPYALANANTATTSNKYNTASEKWNLKMDILDLDMGRWHYVGTKMTVRPSFGVRAAWIRQNATATYSRNLVGSVIADVNTVKARSVSWGVGPTVALDSNWMIGSGFRFFGNGEADLLFTDYTRSTFSETHTATPTQNFYTSQRKIYTVRPHLDLELGFGWGTYLDCNNWYMDFALGYEFQVFFNQNMFRHFSDDTMVGNSTLSNGDLYLQGLTASFKLDF
jgi:hypothetical protein